MPLVYFNSFAQVSPQWFLSLRSSRQFILRLEAVLVGMVASAGLHRPRYDACQLDGGEELLKLLVVELVRFASVERNVSFERIATKRCSARQCAPF
jgi:hypothetical protein